MPLMYSITVEKRAWVFPQVRHRAPDRQPARGLCMLLLCRKGRLDVPIGQPLMGIRHRGRVCRLIPALHELLPFDETFCPLQVGYTSAIDKSMGKRNVVGGVRSEGSEPPGIFYDASCGESSSASCLNAAGQPYVPNNEVVIWPLKTRAH